MYRKRKDETIFVPWMSVLEWHYVRQCVFSQAIQLQKEGYERLVCWQERLWKRCPVAIECTSNLIEVKLTEASSHIGSLSLAKLYSLAVLRSVGMLTDALQQGGQAVPMHKLASQAGIPEWIVDLRHEATHSLGAPSLSVVRKAADYLLDWLKREYWDTFDPDMSVPEEEQLEEQSDYKTEDDLRSIVLDFQQEQFQLCMCGKKDPSRVEEILRKLRIRLSTEDARNTLCSILIQDGYLISTTEQASALNVTEICNSEDTNIQMDRRIVRFWRPLISAVSHEGLIPKLLVALVTRLNKTSSLDANNPTNDVVLGWISVICNAMLNGNSMSSFVSKKSSLEAWYPVIVACVAEVNTYSSVVLKILLSTVCVTLPSTMKEQLYRVLEIGPGLSDDGKPQAEQMETGVEHTVESKEEVSRLFHGNAASEEEVAAQLRGQCFTPWSRAPESVRWGRYPIGKIPGQSEDPQDLSFLGRTDIHASGELLSDDKSSDQNRSHYGEQETNLSPDSGCSLVSGALESQQPGRMTVIIERDVVIL